jgi:hypothetical protein
MRVAAKAHNALKVTDQTGTIRPLKLLNHVSSSVANKHAKLDGTAVADPDAGYQNGYTLAFPDLNHYIISRIVHEYYKEAIIRASLELILCNNTVTILRQVPVLNNQGGVKGHVDAPIYTDLPCKIIPMSEDKDKQDDVFLNNYILFLPITNPIEVNDKLQFGHSFLIAKANGVKDVSEGLIEVLFNRDTRW